MPKIKAIFWDLDGTITDSKSALVEMIQRKLLEELGWEVTLTMVVYYFNNGVKDMLKKIARDLEKEITPEKVEQVARVILEEKCETNLPIIAGVLEKMEEMKAQGLKLALCSNNLHKDLDRILAHLKMENYFDVIVGEDDVENKKPAPDMLLKALEILGLEKDEVVHIEDSSPGIKAGKNAGVKVLAVATGIQDLEMLERFEPDRVVANLEEISLEEILGM